MVIKIRPEITTLPNEHMVVKVSEIPSGVNVLRINQPFTLTHLSRCFNSAFIIAGTGKSMMTILGEESARIKQYLKEMTEMIVEKYPILHKKVTIQACARVAIGSTGGGNKPMKFVANLKKLVESFEECGFSDIPMKSFQVPVQTKKGTQWAAFQKRGDLSGFILASIGEKTYLQLKKEEIQELVQNNVGLLKAKAHICTAKINTGKWLSCEV